MPSIVEDSSVLQSGEVDMRLVDLRRQQAKRVSRLYHHHHHHNHRSFPRFVRWMTSPAFRLWAI